MLQTNTLTYSKSSKLLLLAVGVLVGGLLFFPSKAAAYTGSNTTASDIPSSVPLSIRQGIAAQCNAPNYYHVVQEEWLSDRGNSASQDAIVAYGATRVPMQLNGVTYRCAYEATAVTAGTYKIISTSPNIPTINNDTGQLPYVGTGGSGAIVKAAIEVFDYQNSGSTPFYQTGIITLNMTTRGTVSKSNGTYYCAKVNSSDPTIQVATAYSFSQCTNDPGVFRFHITISPAAPVVQGYKLATTGGYQTITGTGSANTTNPFSDDTITARRADGATETAVSNPFYFNSTYGNTVGPGTYTFSLGARGTADTGWVYKGYTICNASSSSCNSTYLDNVANVQPATSTHTLADGSTYNMRFLFAPAPAGAPVVTISCTASGGTYTLMGTAIDPDKAIALSIQYFKSGTATPLSTSATNATGSFSLNVTPYMGTPLVTTGFYVKVKGVNSAGTPALPDTTSAVATCAVAACIPGNPGCPPFATPSPCPGDANIAANSLVTVNLPDQTPAGRTAAPSGYTTNPGATYEQDNPLPKTLVTSVQDVSSGGARISVPIVGSSNNYQTVTLQYKAYVDGMPYDPNQASVSYDSDYRRTDWYVTFDHYQCDGYSPASLSGGGCSYSHPAPCSLSESLSGTTCSGSYNATAYYRWVNNGTYNAPPINNTVNAYAMNACFNRNYNVSSVSATAAFDNNEDPSTADVTGNATVDFIVPAGFPAAPNGLRTPVKVNLNFSAGPCPALSGSRTFNGSSVLPSLASLALDSGSCPVSAPPLQPGDTVCIVYDVFPKSGEVKIDGTPVGASGTESSPPGCTLPVENNPYVHVLGLDASAGGNFASGLLDQCVGASPASGTISANLRSTGPLTRGSGVQLGALAIGSISGFASATYRTGPTPPVASSGLTFANYGTNGNLGGQHCVPDYYSTMPSGATSISGSFSLSSFNSPRNPPVDQVYNASSDIVINGPSGLGAGIAEGNRIAIYVNGDVYINTDIKFKNESWSSEDNIPSLFIVAKGNIYVDPAVERLDGVYVAQPNGASGGTINTCAPGFASFSATLLYDSCRDHKLMVNGAFIANTVNFLRTFSSLRTSLGGERPGTTANGTENQNSPTDCDGNVRTGTRSLADTGHDCAAEIINFSPETYLTRPAMLPVGGPAVGKYDYITSLSPIL